MSQCTDARLHMRAMPVFWSGRNLNGPGYESVQLEDLVDGEWALPAHSRSLIVIYEAARRLTQTRMTTNDLAMCQGWISIEYLTRSS